MSATHRLASSRDPNFMERLGVLFGLLLLAALTQPLVGLGIPVADADLLEAVRVEASEEGVPGLSPEHAATERAAESASESEEEEDEEHGASAAPFQARRIHRPSSAAPQRSVRRPHRHGEWDHLGRAPPVGPAGRES